MDVSFLIKQYFAPAQDVSIDVFDAESLYGVYRNVMRILTSHLEIEVSVLQALSYCFYEILDNVHIHSGKPLGTAITFFDQPKNILKILVADDGKGIWQSLKENPSYADITEEESLRACLRDSVTDGKGMGFGLYATSRMMKDAGIKLVLHSGHHKLVIQNDQTVVTVNGFWQGTILYIELNTSMDIDPQSVVEHRTDAEGEYNEGFIETEELTSLW